MLTIIKGKEVKLWRMREALEDQALLSLRKIVLTHEELQGYGSTRDKAARKFPLIMKKARRLIYELSSDKLAA